MTTYTLYANGLHANGDKFLSVFLRRLSLQYYNIGFLLNILHAIAIDFRNSVFVTLFSNMADTIEDFEKVQKLHSKRCCNPLRKEGHCGKDLRKISKAVLEMYPSLHPRSKICHDCRETFYKTQKDQLKKIL